MRKLYLLALIVAQGAIGQKSFDIAEFYPINRGHSFVAFSVKYMGYAEVRGNFADFKGTFRYDPDDVSKTSVSFWIDVNSIDTDHEWRDKDLKSDQWFDAEKYPSITFSSSSARKTETGFELTGNLNVKDISKEITITMNPSSGILKDVRGDKQVIFTGSYTLDRSEFGVMGERWSRVKEGIVGVANEVTVEFSMLGKQVQKENFSNWVRREDRPPGRLYTAYKKGGLEETFSELEKLKSEIELRTSALNTVGLMLLKTGEVKDAVAVMEKNKEEFPDDAGVYDSLGEAYANAGDLKKAKENYQLAVEKDPENINAKEILRNLN